MVCSACHIQAVPRLRRKYCTVCGLRASVLWKRAKRHAWKQSGQKYWLDNWKHKSDAERRAYFREYMRAYRRKMQYQNGRGNM